MERYAKKITILFIVAQLILYVAFLTVDLTGGSITLSRNMKFIIIILCFCYALFLGKGADKSILFCMKTALFFTLVSDLFILMMDYYYDGVLTFIFAQQLYGIRLSMEKYNIENEKEQRLLRRDFVIRLSIQAALLIAIALLLVNRGTKLDRLLIVSIFYFISIVTNVIRAVTITISSPKKKELILFTVGILLFLLCDINVGLFNMAGYLSLPKDVYTVLYSMASILMWAFYAPSQVFLALSTHERKREFIRSD